MESLASYDTPRQFAGACQAEGSISNNGTSHSGLREGAQGYLIELTNDKATVHMGRQQWPPSELDGNLSLAAQHSW